MKIFEKISNFLRAYFSVFRAFFSLYGAYLKCLKRVLYSIFLVALVITDHQSLKWLQRLESPTGLLARWLFEIHQYDCDVKYRRGTLNRVADALSRQPEVCVIRPIQCRWYRRLHDNVTRDPTNYPDYRRGRASVSTHPSQP